MLRSKKFGTLNIEYIVFRVARSSNGRTAVFGTANLGSNPSLATVQIMLIIYL